MKTAKVEDAHLDDMVSVLRKANFNEKYDMNSDSGTTWRMYTRLKEGIYDVAYLNNECELILSQTFKQLPGKISDEQLVTSVLKSYEKHVAAVEKKKQGSNWQKGLFVGTFALGLAIPLKAVGLVGGAAIGYLTYKSFRDLQVNYKELKLIDYIENHNIVLGNQAYKQLQQH